MMALSIERRVATIIKSCPFSDVSRHPTEPDTLLDAYNLVLEDRP